MSSTRIPKTDPHDSQGKKWLREWSTAMMLDGRLHPATIQSGLILALHAWESTRTVAMSSRSLAKMTGRSYITESQHLNTLCNFGWFYDTGKRQWRRPVLQLQLAPGWESFKGRNKPLRGWTQDDEDPPLAS